MRLPDGTVLMHVRTPYDPVKAHQYYLRTRQLKGRTAGRAVAPTRKNPLVGDTSVRTPTFKVRLADGGEAILTQQQLTEQKAYAAKRVREIKSRLHELGSQLRKAMADAKEKKAKAEREADKPPSAAEKADAARESKQYREKHKTTLANKAKRTESKKESTDTDPVAELETKVTQIKDSLKAAVASQRALAAATRNS